VRAEAANQASNDETTMRQSRAFRVFGQQPPPASSAPASVDSATAPPTQAQAPPPTPPAPVPPASSSPSTPTEFQVAEAQRQTASNAAAAEAGVDTSSEKDLKAWRRSLADQAKARQLAALAQAGVHFAVV
jgi:hypothetical protein